MSNQIIKLNDNDRLIVDANEFTSEDIADAITQWAAEELADNHGLTEEELTQAEAQLG